MQCESNSCPNSFALTETLQDGQTFFVALFRSWCYNGVATFSLCLLAQAYEQAYNLLQILLVSPATVPTAACVLIWRSLVRNLR